MRRIKLLPFALLALSQGVIAQTPGAAGQFQQIPPPPVIPKAAPDVRIEHNASAVPAPATDLVKVVVSSLRVTGSRAYSEPALLALTGFKPNPPKLVAGVHFGELLSMFSQ